MVSTFLFQQPASHFRQCAAKLRVQFLRPMSEPSDIKWRTSPAKPTGTERNGTTVEQNYLPVTHNFFRIVLDLFTDSCNRSIEIEHGTKA